MFLALTVIVLVTVIVPAHGSYTSQWVRGYSVLSPEWFLHPPSVLCQVLRCLAQLKWALLQSSSYEQGPL